MRQITIANQVFTEGDIYRYVLFFSEEYGDIIRYGRVSIGQNNEVWLGGYSTLEEIIRKKQLRDKMEGYCLYNLAGTELFIDLRETENE